MIHDNFVAVILLIKICGQRLAYCQKRTGSEIAQLVERLFPEQ